VGVLLSRKKRRIRRWRLPAAQARLAPKRASPARSPRGGNRAFAVAEGERRATCRRRARSHHPGKDYLRRRNFLAEKGLTGIGRGTDAARQPEKGEGGLLRRACQGRRAKKAWRIVSGLLEKKGSGVWIISGDWSPVDNLGNIAAAGQKGGGGRSRTVRDALGRQDLAEVLSERETFETAGQRGNRGSKSARTRSETRRTRREGKQSKPGRETWPARQKVNFLRRKGETGKRETKSRPAQLWSMKERHPTPIDDRAEKPE